LLDANYLHRVNSINFEAAEHYFESGRDHQKEARRRAAIRFHPPAPLIHEKLEGGSSKGNG